MNWSRPSSSCECGAAGWFATALQFSGHNETVGVALLLFHVVGEHPVNVVTVARGDLHAGGAHFINPWVGFFS